MRFLLDPLLTPEQVDRMAESLAAKLAQNPDNVGGWVMLARTYYSRNRHAEAAKAFARAARKGDHRNARMPGLQRRGDPLHRGDAVGLEIVALEGKSYRLKEAEARAALKAKSRTAKARTAR